MIEDTDGLYLMGERVMNADQLSISYQSNDLSKPDSQESSFSRTFNLPHNVATSRFLQFSEQLDSASQLPYQLLPAYLVFQGELLFNGFAKLSAFAEAYEVELRDAKADLFTRLDRSIRTLNLSRFDHKWSLETMNRLAKADDGACYPLIDYGLLNDGKLPADALFPAMFMKTLVAQMLQEEGFVLRGDLPTDAMYRALAIPFVESEPTAQDEEWQKVRTSTVSWNPGYDDSISRTIFGRAAWLDRIQPFNIDNQPLNGLSQGRMQNYDVTTFTYVCDTTMRVQVQATQTLKLTAITGSVEAFLILEKNGRGIENASITTGSGYNLLGSRTDQLNLDTTVSCQAGDRLQIRLQVNRQTRTGAWTAEVYNNPDNARVSFTPKIELATEGNWIVSRNLPDVTCKRVLLNLAYLYSGTWQVDSLRHEIRLSKLNETVFSETPVDWSRRIDESQPGRRTWELEGYAQKNYLRWKENEETQKGADGMALTIPYGDGLIEVKSQAIDPQVDLFEMDFAASINSTASIPNYGTPLLIKTRVISGTGENQTIDMQAASPRLILVHPDNTVGTTVTRLAADGQTVEEVQVNLRACWFGTRPSSQVSQETNFSLCFSTVPGNRGERSLIEANYSGLQRVLRRMRTLTLNMSLNPEDISSLDFTKPVRLRRVSIGALNIENELFYLNKIGDYGIDGLCAVTLVGY